jgi:hypothetical protein
MTGVDMGTFIWMLALMFIGLKLTGFIAWSWVWVLCPLWIPVVIVITPLIIMGLAMAIAAISDVFYRIF